MINIHIENKVDKLSCLLATTTEQPLSTSPSFERKEENEDQRVDDPACQMSNLYSLKMSYSRYTIGVCAQVMFEHDKLEVAGNGDNVEQQCVRSLLPFD